MVLRNLGLDPGISYMSDSEDCEIPIDLSKKEGRDIDIDSGCSSNNYIPLSKIHSRSSESNAQPTEILSKRARLDSLISQIKSKPTSIHQKEEDDEEEEKRRISSLHHSRHPDNNNIPGDINNPQQYTQWMYLNYYQQIIQTIQAQQLIRQYAIQNTNTNNNNIIQDKIVGGYGSPCSARSSSPDGGLSSGEHGLTPGSSGHGNGKRAPRAMTGRHVRTGTGASPSTLQTLRLKIQERQRLREQGKINQENKQKNKKDSKKRK